MTPKRIWIFRKTKLCGSGRVRRRAHGRARLSIQGKWVNRMGVKKDSAEKFVRRVASKISNRKAMIKIPNNIFPNGIEDSGELVNAFIAAVLKKNKDEAIPAIKAKWT